MDRSTVLVGDLIDSLLRTEIKLVTQSQQCNIQTQTCDDEGVGDEGDQHQEGHHPPIDRLHHLQGPQPGGGVHQVTAALGCTSKSKKKKKKNAKYDVRTLIDLTCVI